VLGLLAMVVKLPPVKHFDLVQALDAKDKSDVNKTQTSVD